MSLFDPAYQKTGAKEGGYVFNAKDPGGETNLGITKYVAMKNGYSGDMKLLTKEKAREIYKKEYWDGLLLDNVTDQGVAEELFDTGVNCGQGTSAGFIQKCLNAMNKQGTRWNDLKEDGSIGVATISALNVCLSLGYKAELLKALNCLQGAYYIDISRRNPNLEEFIIGWFRNRVEI